MAARPGRFKVDDLRSLKWWKSWPRRFGSRLRIDLAITFDDFSIKATVEIRILLRGVVVIVSVGIFVTVPLIQRSKVRRLLVLIAVNRIAIQRPGDRSVITNLHLQMNRRDVIVIIVSSTTVPPPVIEFSGKQRVSSTIVLDGIENRNAIDSDSNGSSKEVVLRRHGFLCRNWMQRNLPCVAAGILLRHRHLLLPCRDTNHHLVIRKTVRFDEKVVRIRSSLHGRLEGLETLLKQRKTWI